MAGRPASQTVFEGSSHTYGGINAQGNTFSAQGNITLSSSASAPPSDCLSLLRLTNPRDDRNEILGRKDKLLKDSCLWICNDPGYLRWRDSDESQVLWLHGDPGKGKTMIMMALTDEIPKMAAMTSPSTVSSYFFCQSTNSNNNSATSVLRGLIYLLVKDRPKLLAHAQKQFNDAGTRLLEGSSALYSLWGILSDIANDPSLTRVYLMIDALDECNVQSKNLLDLILNSELRHSQKIKWLVSSRNDIWIQERLESGDGRQHTSLELNSRHVSAAVRNFIDLKLEDLAREKKYDAELKKSVKDYLVDHADDTFLWVALVCKELANTPLRKSRATVLRFPSHLEPLYSRMLLQVDNLPMEDRTFCRRILQAVTLSTRPLTLEELVFVAALPAEEFRKPQAVREVVQQCGSFLILRGDVCYFVHQSAKDYFDHGLGARVFDAGQTQAHSRLSGRCLELMSRTLRQDMCDLKYPGIRRTGIDEKKIDENIASDLRYACRSWIDHLIKSGLYKDKDGQMSGTNSMRVFFKRSLLYWLETLSLLGRVDEAVIGLHALEAVLQARSE